MSPKPLTCGIVTALSLSAGCLSAQSASNPDDAAELAKKPNNPVAALISVTIQANSLFNAGPGDGFRETTNIQPVIRFVFTFLFPKS